MSLQGTIKGLHHVTATVNDVQEDYDFYTRTLGLRLVKETVNFDDENVYHFYYGNEIGLPSTIFTTFPYKGQSVQQGTVGTGQVFQTSFNVPSASIEFWKNRLVANGVEYEEIDRFGTLILEFRDPSGLLLAITPNDEDDRQPLWFLPEIGEKNAIVGIHSVTLLLSKAEEAIQFLNLFGYSVKEQESDIVWLEAGDGGAGNTLFIEIDPKAKVGKNGIGTVHHVAHRVANREVLEQVRDFVINDLQLQPTEVKDRKYFKSIYFRIPGGVLFEVATEDPGFMIDEPKDRLGTGLMLPNWQEERREQIETNLLPYKR